MSLQPSANNNAAGFTANGGVNLQLPLKFGTGTNANYTYTAKRSHSAPNTSRIGPPTFFKTFLKDDKLKYPHL